MNIFLRCHNVWTQLVVGIYIEKEIYMYANIMYIYIFSNKTKEQELASERGAGTTSYIASQVFWSMSFNKNIEC